MWWSWNPRARALFSRIDGLSWSRYRNPVEVLSQPIAWSELLDDPAFMAEYTQVLAEFDRYMAGGREHWFNREYGAALKGPIGYFCAEYGFHESLGIYSGGLGVLAGDHIKSASDMAMPFVGVGLLYKHGYFRQTIDADGHQEHAYPDYDLAKLPILRVLGQDGEPLTDLGRAARTATCTPPSGSSRSGRVPVLLLDTDIPDNAESDRPVTHILYVRGREMRLHQELVLGAGGVRALKALGITPAVWHLNEGHSAFLLVERTRALVAQGVALDDALDRVRSNSVFTIHTPVSAGNERFDADLVRRVAGPLYDGDGRKGTGGVPMDRVLELARGVDGDTRQFDMTALSLRLSNAANAVSKLHSVTANNTWQGLGDKQILAVTNGVHMPTWVGQPMRDLFERYLGAELDNVDARNGSDRFWERTDQIPDVDLWEAHQRQKLELMIFARNRLRHQFARHGESPGTLEELEDVLDVGTLTIGFARRFATYKRASLLFSDMDRISPAAVGQGPAGPDHLRRQGPPGRPAGPGRDPGDLRPVPLAAAARSSLHPRGLRHARGPVHGPGRGRVAQQPAPPAGSVRHERHEGRLPTASSTSPSSTAGGTKAGSATTAGPSAAARRTRTKARRTTPTRRTSTGCSSRKSCRSTTAATRTTSRRAGRPRCAAPSPARSGGSPRSGCSTSTSRRCTCRRPASRSRSRRAAARPPKRAEPDWAAASRSRS